LQAIKLYMEQIMIFERINPLAKLSYMRRQII
jgi:hypothetical protein